MNLHNLWRRFHCPQPTTTKTMKTKKSSSIERDEMVQPHAKRQKNGPSATAWLTICKMKKVSTLHRQRVKWYCEAGAIIKYIGFESTDGWIEFVQYETPKTKQYLRNSLYPLGVFDLYEDAKPQWLHQFDELTERTEYEHDGIDFLTIIH